MGVKDLVLGGEGLSPFWGWIYGCISKGLTYGFALSEKKFIDGFYRIKFHEIRIKLHFIRIKFHGNRIKLHFNITVMLLRDSIGVILVVF